MASPVMIQYQRLVQEARAALEADEAAPVRIQVGSATCEHAAGSERVHARLKRLIADSGRTDILLRITGCTGRCSREPIVSVHVPGLGPALYQQVDAAKAERIFHAHVLGSEPVPDLLLDVEGASWGEGKGLFLDEDDPLSRRRRAFYGDAPFFSRQSRVALRNVGILDPTRIEDYIGNDGFRALARVLEAGDRQAVIDTLTASRLRGRGGAGYPTGRKWADACKSSDPVRYLICNADEGDPGAFMDRSMLESDPFSVIEGMLIGGFAIGAERGFFYIRSEYPLAVERVRKAIDEARKKGLLGAAILGSGFSFDLEIRLGGGAFVCGEETALIASIEGLRGWPRIRPPYPTQRGLWQKPTVINNVETFANVPVVIDRGADWFARLGTAASGGTKVFALAGKVRHTGLVEVPMGASLHEIVEVIGGGVPGGRRLKAIQTGGPAGGCIPADQAGLGVDYDTLSQAGSIMGSGGMIVMDEDDCMVDIAKFYMRFCHDESCGQCTPCREGTKRMLEILERITEGRGEAADLVKLERLGKLIRKASLCGLGRAAANPVLSTLRYFRSEYDAHVLDKRCPAGRCKALAAAGGH